LAIVGDYGTGKTHIAQDMLRQIAAEGNPNLHPLYLDAPSDTFLALYKERFLRKLDRNTVLRRVDEYYADIVADELIKSKLTRPVAEALRKREISPDEVVRNFGLIESKFVRALAKKLKAVTEQSDFGTALLLLRRPEFQAGCLGVV
jgi:KaiC/GvpD/RAD55 family RecA-like ATPase